MQLSITRTDIFRFALSILALGLAALAAPANAQTINLDPITVVATKTAEAVSDTLAAISTVRGETLDQISANQPKDLFIATPGVWTQTRADDPGQSINIRGLQDFGRVAVTIDGARQNFQHSGHNADGQYYIDPNMIGGVDVSRGPIANIYGSGAIGGVVVYRTKDIEDILKPGEKWATEGKTGWSTNRGNDQSAFFGAKAGDNIDIFAGGTYRKAFDYKDGNGNTVPNTHSETWSGTSKITIRPAEGHTIKFGYTRYESDFDTGQPFFSLCCGPPPAQQVTTIYGTHVLNQTANARWLYKSPDNPWIDFDANIYWTGTKYDQIKIGGLGALGGQRFFNSETTGFDLHNTSRFDTGPWRHALTYGVDGFQDKALAQGSDTPFTPDGKRTVSGAFAQLTSNYSSWLEFISAVRFDHYQLEGSPIQTDGSRVSPKFTVGITPFKGFQPYASYAEGYRAPSLTETLVNGIHPGGPPFQFLPNPSLKPEVGKNKEIGINLKYDNILVANDSFRGKVNVYRNNVDNFIGLKGFFNGVPPDPIGTTCTANSGDPNTPDCFQYQNIPHAQLEGAEFETMYDAGKWFAGLAGSHVRGKNTDTGAPLDTIPPDFITTTLGTRISDRLTAAVRWQAVAAKKADEIPAGSLFAPTGSFNLINLYLGYQISPNALAAFSIENLLDEQYSRYMSVWANDFGVTGPVNVPFPEPGITLKASLKVRFGG
jgi:hemoglobin/transferrin/lactoferrin receptor protein